MGIGQVSPDGYVAPSINPANLLCTIFCICACIGTYLYLQYKEKYNKRRNEEYEKGMPNNRGRPASKEKREDLEKMLKEMQVQANKLKKAVKSMQAEKDAVLKKRS